MYKQLESSRLLYRPFVEEDVTFLEALMTNEDVCTYLPGPKAYPKEVIPKLLAYYMTSAFDKDDYQKIYVVTEKDTKNPIGYCGIQRVKEFDAYEIFYGYHPSYWNKGYGKETSLRMKELAQDLNMSYLIALADINNIASQKILERTGYQKIKQIHLWGLDLYFYEMTL